MAKHRVLFFVQDFGASGAEKVALNMLLDLAKDSEFECAIVLRGGPGTLLHYLPKQVQVFDLSEQFGFLEKVWNAIGVPVFKNKILKIQDEFKANIWYLNSVSNQALAAYAPNGVRCILHIHESHSIFEKNPGKDFHSAKGKINKIVCPNPKFASFFEKIYQKPVLVVPSINEAIILEDTKTTNSGNALPKIYSAGYLSYAKGADLFFEMSNRFIGKAEFVWLGELTASLFSAYFQELHQLGEYPNLKIISGLVGKDYFQELQKANLFLFCSREESMGLVGMEAIRLGVPVLSTPSGGPSYYINSHNGKILKSFDLEEMSGVLESMLNSMDDYPAIRVKNALTLPNFEACFAEVKSQIFD